MAIQFKAKLWAGMEGTINGFAFKTSAFPDGDGSHQFMVNGTMRAGAKAAIGDTATFVIQPASDTVEFEIPSDLSAALKKTAKASQQWEKITPKAKAEWALWITSAKKEETRIARLAKAIERLTKGDKRPSD
ncbi:YdeI/OmpD-associated family protein [Acidobacterium sp. S8]|uniref:YdeI/OmpD-associated family protein n=1 Tax=Acidobacterium sp. S8 TaxID=1641854 RepID=UPI00131AC53F|nr:YdeI/OmpD-associated family protein [Acidobacterium sp. S8]